MLPRLNLMPLSSSGCLYWGLSFVARRWQRLQFLTGLKSNGFAGRNANLLAGPWVAADAGLARFHIKNAESAKLDAVAATQGILHCLEDRLHGLFGFRAGYVRFLNDCIYDVELDHNGLPLDRKPMLDRGLQVVKPSAVGYTAAS